MKGRSGRWYEEWLARIEKGRDFFVRMPRGGILHDWLDNARPGEDENEEAPLLK